jgi:CRISPR-associated protein Csb1
MSIDYDRLKEVPKLLMEAQLKPRQGDRFQPTGFADLGAATYERPDGVRMILVDTVQSIANRLEATILENGVGPKIQKELGGISYIVSHLKGKDRSEKDINIETSSLIEPHRLNSPYIIKDKKLQNEILARSGYGDKGPINWQKIGETLFYYDVNSLLHGTFLSNLKDGGRFRVPRILSGFIEAENVNEVFSGGVKNNAINDPTGSIVVDVKEEKNIYTSVPFMRTEYTAKKITAYFNIDLSLIESYNLDKSANNLLISLALYKIRKFLTTGLRLRTACDLEQVGDLVVNMPEGFDVPDEKKILDDLKIAINECKDKKLLNGLKEVEVRVKERKKKDNESSTENEESDGENSDNESE